MLSNIPDFPKINPPGEADHQKDEGISELEYGNILQKSFVYLMVGRPGCGKSHLISELITREDFYKKEFNRIILISPSRLSSKIFNADDPLYSPVLTDDHIEFVIDFLNTRTAAHPDRFFNFLFVLDDCVARLQHLEESSPITNLFFNRRHIVKNASVSLIVTTQEFKSITPKVRSVVTGLFLFHPSPKDLFTLKGEYVLDSDLMKHLCLIVNEYLDSDEHEFIFIELLPELEAFYNFLKIY